jgi:thiamine-phosphate pyrophosphorylase
MLRYAITDRRTLGPGDPTALLAAQAGLWARAGIDWVQMREKDLSAGELERVARAMLAAIRSAGGRTRLLVNGRVDVALAAGADGVHLTAHPEELGVVQVRRLWTAERSPVISVSCHSVEEVDRAREGGADMALFGPVFGKRLPGERTLPGLGLERLREACHAGEADSLPVLALGGVTEKNTAQCLAAGTAGVAGIRLFGAISLEQQARPE